MESDCNPFSNLLCRFTAADLMCPCCGMIESDTSVKAVLEMLSQELVPKHRLPHYVPFSVLPDAKGPDTLALVVKDGRAVGCVDPVMIAQIHLQQTMHDLEMTFGDEWKKPVSTIMAPLELLPRIMHSCSALDAALELSRHGANLVLVEQGNQIVGFISFGCLLQPAFTLPLFGLLLEIERQILELVSNRAKEAFECLSSGRQEKVLKMIDISNPLDEAAGKMMAGENVRYSVPLMHSLNAWLFPEEHEEAMKLQMDKWGVPAIVLIEYTTFCDKGTMIRKLKMAPNGQPASDSKRFWKQAEDVRNAIAHGRSWWQVLKTPSELEGFIAQSNECLNWLRVSQT